MFMKKVPSKGFPAKIIYTYIVLLCELYGLPIDNPNHGTNSVLFVSYSLFPGANEPNAAQDSDI
jgi:hypothetical protein